MATFAEIVAVGGASTASRDEQGESEEENGKACGGSKTKKTRHANH
jgi:hypothetical protein